MNFMRAIIAYLFFASVTVFAAEPSPNQLPQGGVVSSGLASIALDSNSSQININQSSQRAIINWQSFDVGERASVNFHQPSQASITLNKINSNNPSQIFGQIRANGQIILQNSSGVYFGKNSRVDVGAIIATTHAANEDKFMQGALEFHRNGSTASVINDGEIKASLNGYVALLAPEVRNRSLIVAQMGTVVMAAGEQITLNFNTNNHLSSITTTPATIDTLIENKHAVQAHGGTIILSAKALSQLVSGIINQEGLLDAGSDALNVVKIGGRIFLSGDQTILAENSVTTASGAESGGEISIEAHELLASASSTVNVSASQQGNGGSIAISAKHSELSGTFLATGGAASGDGGQIDISSNSLITAESTTMQAGSLTHQGAPGNITIETDSVNEDSQLLSVISESIASANVTILTSGVFNFDQASVVEKTTAFQTLLTVNAADTITMAGQITSDVFSPLGLLMISAKGINFTDTSDIQVAYLEARAPEIKATGNIWTYGGQGSHTPFMQITASRLLISRTLRSGSQNNRGSIYLNGNRSVAITSTASIIASGNEGGLIEIISANGLASIEGLVQTNGSNGRGGTIKVDNTSAIELTGASLQANGVDGGSVSLVANDAVVINNSSIQTNASNGRGGTISASAYRQVLLKNTAVQSIGFQQGGTVLIGNDVRNHTLPFAQFTQLDALSSIQAYALSSNLGGFIETSGQTISLLATINAGRGGMWLIDPFDLVIDSVVAININSALQAGQNVTLTTALETNTINTDPATTTTGTEGLGNITLNAAISSSGDGDLMLTAENNIYINAAITLSGTDSGVTLDGTTIYLGANITTTGDQLFDGQVVLNASPVLSSGNASVTITGNISATSGVAAFLGNGYYLFNGTQYLAGSSADASQPIGVIYNSGTQVYSWLATTSVAETLMVAGGGGGGKDIGGGGGGGGVIAQTVNLTPGWTELAVGDGGIGSVRPNTAGEGGNHQWRVNGTQGGNSTLATASGTLTAIGGGYGGTGPWGHTLQGAAGAGGSGGGASGYSAGTSGRNGAGTAGQGYAGASGDGSHVSGGGGGAGGPGSTGRSHGASSGGAGVQNCILGTCYYWGGGGGGAGHSYRGGNGGIGGGGGGGSYNGAGGTGNVGLNGGSSGGSGRNRPGGHGGVNTGGGGGGGTHHNANNEGGNGGSGIVVVSYQNMLTINSGNGAIDLQGNVAGAGLALTTNSVSSQVQGNVTGDIGITKLGTGTLNLSGNNTYTGSTILSAGIIKAGSANALSSTSLMTLAASTSLDLNNYSVSVGSISGSGTITNSVAGSAVLNTGNLNTSTTFSGVIENGSGTVGITKSGSGTLTLIGTNTYSGTTTLTDGLIGLGSADAIGSAGSIVFNGGGIQYSASNTTDFSSGSRLAGGTQFFNIDTNGQDITWAGSLTNDASSFTKTGLGNLTLSGTIGATTDGFDPMDMSFNGGSITLSGTVHAISSLVMATATTLDVTQSGLIVTGTSSLGGSIQTAGTTSFGGAMTLVANTTITSNNHTVTLGGATNGEFELTINAGSGAVALGAVGNVTPVARLDVTSTTSITLNGNITTVMGLADGWLFEKFNGYFPTNTMSFAAAAPKVIRTTEMTGASGSDTSMVYNEMRVCPRNDCDSSFTYRVTGYFIPTSTGNWSFAFNGDDGHLLYMGTAGQTLANFQSIIESNSSWNYAPKNFVTGNTGCCGTQTGTRALVQGEMYPVYASMGEGGGGDYFNIRLRKPDGSWIAGGQSNTSYGTGLYYTPGGAGGASTRAGAYLTGNVVLSSDVIITSPNATATVTGSISGLSSNENLTVNTGTFTTGNISGLGSVSLQTSNATIGNVSSVASTTFAGTINAGNFVGVNNITFNTSNISVGALNVANAVTFNGVDNLTFANTISGTGKLVKSGTNTLIVSGDNTFSGGVDLSGGVLELGSANAIGSLGDISMLGGTLKFTSSNTTDYSSRFSAADNQAFKFDTNGQNVTLSTNLVGSGGTLEKMGSGRLTLQGANTYTGGTIITAGDLYLNSAGALSSLGNIVFSGSGRIWHTANNNVDYSNRFTSTANQSIRIHIDDGVTVTWASGISGSGVSITKDGAGPLVMSGSSSNTGFTKINDGVISLGRNNALSTNSALQISGGGSNYIDLNGYSQSLVSLSGNGLIKNTSASDAILTITGSSTTTLSGYLSQTNGIISLVKSGSGELILTGRQNFSGDITINAGTLTAGNANTDGFGSGNIIFAGGTLKYQNQSNDYSARISTNSQAIKINTNGRDVTWATDLLNPSSSITKSGAGTFTVSGTIGVNNSDADAPGYDASFVPLNLSVMGGTLSLPGTVQSMGNISLQGGSLNCPNCPSLGNFVAAAGATITFSSAIFDSLSLAAGVTMTANSVTVYNTASIGGAITTTGPMTFGGAVTLVAPTTLISTNNPISFNSTVDGFTSLTVDAGSSTVAFLGAVGGTTNLSNLTVTGQAGIILNSITIMGLSDGLLFEKFDGNWANDVRRLIGRAQQVVRTSEIIGAPGNQTGQIHNGIDICRGGNCDSTYTYRITGYFMPEQTGTHTFYMLGDDQNYLYLGSAGQSLTDYQNYAESVQSYNKTGLVVSQTGCCSWRNGSVSLTAGELYPLYSVFMEGGGGDYLRMYWKNPDNSQPAWMSGSNQAANGTGYFYNLGGGGGGGAGLGGVTLNGPVTVNQNTVISSSRSAVVINGDVTSSDTPRNFTVIADTLTADGFNGLSGLTLNVADDSSVDGVIAGSATVLTKTGDGDLSLTAANTFGGSTVISGGSIVVSQGDVYDTTDPENPIFLRTNAGTLGASLNTLTLSGGGLKLDAVDLTLYDLTMNAGSTITSIGSGSSSLTLPVETIGTEEVPSVATSFTLGGSINFSGIIDIQGPVTLSGNTTINSNGNGITFGNVGTVAGGGYNLTLNSGAGITTLNADITSLNNFSSLGATTTKLTILSTLGTQQYGALTLLGGLDLSTTNSNITFDSTINGAFQLTTSTGTGTTYFMGAVGTNDAATTLTALGVTGPAYVAGGIYTSGDLTFSSDISINGSRSLESFNRNISVGGNITAVGNAILALLGSGDYLFNGEASNALTNSTDAFSKGLTFNSGTGMYTWNAAASSAEVLIVAGGGGGGKDMGGGGGGGGVIASSSVAFTPGASYLIGVGAGGLGSPMPNTNGERGGHQWIVNATQGSNSSVATASGTLTAIGGGYGGTGPWNHTLRGQAGSGGSGGGAAGYNAGNSGRNGSGTAGQGYAGASGSSHHVSGGGGGAGGAGSTGRFNGSAAGGPGVQNCILGTCYYWGGGGGGSSYSYTGGNGGIGGGGGGAVGVTTGGAGLNNGAAGGGGNVNGWAQRPGGNGGANTGGGGGGGSHYNANNKGGDGGSGMVAIKYVTNNSLTLKASNGQVNLPDTLTLSNLSSFNVMEQTVRDFNFSGGLTLINTPFNLVNQRLTAGGLSINSGSPITNTSGYASVEITGTSIIAGSITTSGINDQFLKDDPVLLARENTYQAAILEDPDLTEAGRSAYAQAEWGQFYGGKTTIQGDIILTSNGQNVQFNEIEGSTTGSFDLTINAGSGWVVLNGEIGSKATTITNNAAVNILNNNRAVYYGNMNYLTETYSANNQVANLAVTGNEIFIRDDITTYLDQTYTGHVQIGNNGTMVNGVLKTNVSLMSVDPTISFVGQSVLYATTELGALIYKESEEKYSFDDEFATPTHSLALSAKGACWVTGGAIVACQNTGQGNIYKGLDENGEDTAYYNALRPLLSLTEDNITMLFPRGSIDNNINISQLAIPQGFITNGAGSVSSESIAYSGALSQNAFESGPPARPPARVVPNVGSRGRAASAQALANASKISGAGVLGGQIGRAKSSSPIKMMNLEYTGDVIIGTVRSSFSEDGFDDVVFSPDPKSSNVSKKMNSQTQDVVGGVKALPAEDKESDDREDEDENSTLLY